MAASHVGRLELISGMINGLKCIGMHEKNAVQSAFFVFKQILNF